MDNGHHDAIFSGNPDMGSSLNEENWQQSLEISAPVDMPAPEQIATPEQMANLGQLAGQKIATTEDAGLYSAENASTPDSQTPAAQENTYELGQVTPINQPAPAQVQESAPQKYNPMNIRTTGDKLEKSTVPEIDNIISELNQTGNLSNFYDEIRGTDEKPGMMETNLQNSYGRKLGEGEAS